MKRALVSVSDKTNLIEFVSGLKELGYEIISTGGTKKALDNAGLDTIGTVSYTHLARVCWACLLHAPIYLRFYLIHTTCQLNLFV